MDQESRDANSLMVELDRGLQSINIGDQSEAVVRFTTLFQRYPLPILINSACLKLAEAFRNGSNFIRIQICEVLKRNQSHLNKIYNIDDFFRNIFTVTTSNDPIARSVTLLALGNIAPIVSTYKSIHHCISNSLDSSVECELKAAIACAACYVKYSSEFACNIYPKIVSIVDSNKSSTDVRIRALSVLDHGFYNASDAMTVRSFLIDVIERSRLKRLICTCLTLSTKIAYTSLSHIMPQIELLLKIFLHDPRHEIKINSLRNLKFLAEKSPHIWESTHVEPLVSYLESEPTNSKTNASEDQSLCIILSIFCKLLTCQCNFISQTEKSRIFQLCYKLSLNNSNIPVCSMAFELLTVMSEEHSNLETKSIIEYQPSDLTVSTLSAIKEFLINTFTPPRTTKVKNINQRVSQQLESKVALSSKSIYRYIVKLCQLNPNYCPEVMKLVYGKINSKDTSLIDLSPYMTELLCAILQSSPLIIMTPESCWKLIKNRYSEMSETNLLNLCVFFFQLRRLESSKRMEDIQIDKVTQDHSLWFGFKVMRQAMRYGHFEMASLICGQLHEHVTNDTTDFYLKSLGRICAAESLLSRKSDLDANLNLILPLYEEAVSPLRASIGNSRTTNFQLQFLWLRIRNLQAHKTLRQSCRIYEASPINYTTLLSAISTNRGNSEAGLSKLGVLQQMPKIAKDFRHLGDCYENLSMVSFDCDNNTLDYINLLKSSCIIMADAIDAIFQYGKNLPVINKLTVGSKISLSSEHRNLESTCNTLIELLKTEILKPGIFPSLEPIKPLIDLLKKFSTLVLECPFSYPRYFFQPLQSTQIKLAITPKPSSPSGTISLMLNYNLVLKVEGLIQNLSRTKTVVRVVSKVIISVTMTPTKPVDTTFNLNVQSTANPRNNYFKTEFLLPLKWAGSFNVDIDVSTMDEEERIWKTGPTERLNIAVS